MRKNAEPVFPMKYDKDSLVVMDIETCSRRKKMRKLREELLAVEEDRSQGRKGCTVDELDACLDDMIAAGSVIDRCYHETGPEKIGR